MRLRISRISAVWSCKSRVSKPRGFSKPFPFDIVCVIVSWVAVSDRETLKSLALTNKTFSGEADKWIWRETRLDWHSGRILPFHFIDKKLDILLKRPQRARAIVSLTLVANAHFPTREHARFKSRLERLLRSASSLRILRVIDTTDELKLGSLLVDNIDSYPFQLTELSLQAAAAPHALYKTIISQPSLRRLALPNMDAVKWPALDLNDDDLPNLEAIHAPLALLRPLIEGRPVTCISTAVPYIDGIPLLWDAVSASSRPVTSLCVQIATAAFRPIITDLPVYLPSLRFLGCSVIHSSLAGGATNNPFAPLLNMESLECIRWRGTRLGVYLHLMADLWPPPTYAGRSLRFVQWEVPLEARVKSNEVSEGLWERVDSLEKWTMHPREFISPPWDVKDGLIDPLALHYSRNSATASSDCIRSF